MAALSQIPQESIHRLSSGQVIINLAGAVKELVENSLDSGATVIEVGAQSFGQACSSVEGLQLSFLLKNTTGLLAWVKFAVIRTIWC